MHSWRAAVVAGVIAVHSAVPLLVSIGGGVAAPDRWLSYAVPALLVSAALAVVFLFDLPNTMYLVAFAAQWMMVYVVGVPLGDWILLELVLSAVLVAEFALIVEPLTATLTVTVAVSFLALQQGPTTAWNTPLPPVAPGDIAGMVVVDALVLAVAAAANTLRRREARALVANAEKDLVIQRLIDANMEYQRYALEIEQSTVQAERERISREIHDTVGYAFTNQRMMLEASTVLFDRDPGRLKELMRQAQDALNEGYQQVRSALRALRNVGGRGQSLDSRIIQLTRHFSDVAGMQVRYEAIGPTETGSAELDQALFRSAQEGITNAFCHGSARRVTVTLSRRDGALHMRVIDDGVGSQDVEEGIGITGMRERLAPFDGEVRYRSLSPGFVLEVEVPQ